MEFGKLPDISDVHWTLPAEDPKNKKRFHPTRRTRIYVGSPAWANKHWQGKIYPRHVSGDKFLYHYSRNFNCIELNTTHYRIPTVETTAKWLRDVPSHFQFCPKLHKDISHSRMGILDRKLLEGWINFISKLGENLGPCFIQFHELFSYSDKMLLFRFLENWPSEFKLSVELRHPSWFQDNKVLPALTDYLFKRKIGLVVTDVAGRRDVLHTSHSTEWAMIRLIGNDLDQSDERRLVDWSLRISDWHKRGIKHVYLLLHQPDDNWTLEFAQMAERVFSQAGFENLPAFEFVRPRDLLEFTLNCLT